MKGAHLDTHRKWEAELTRMARALSVLSYAILLLISVSAIAIVIFATRAVLQANRPIVDLLHLVGARDSYIARQIDGRFLRTGMLSGFIGVGLGLLTFLLLGLSSGSGMAAASRSLLFSAPEIAIWSYGVPVRGSRRGDLDLPDHGAGHADAAAGCHHVIYRSLRALQLGLLCQPGAVSGAGFRLLFHAPQVVHPRPADLGHVPHCSGCGSLPGSEWRCGDLPISRRAPCLVAGKHQSFWETFAILPLLDDPAMVLKKELTYIPFFGWFIYKFRMIPVERSAGTQALRALLGRRGTGGFRWPAGGDHAGRNAPGAR